MIFPASGGCSYSATHTGARPIQTCPLQTGNLSIKSKTAVSSLHRSARWRRSRWSWQRRLLPSAPGRAAARKIASARSNATPARRSLLRDHIPLADQPVSDRPRTRILLLRGRARPPHISELIDEGRSAAGRFEYCQVAEFQMGGPGVIEIATNIATLAELPKRPD